MSKLFLTSKFSLVSDKLIPYLDKQTGDMTVLFIDTAAKPYVDKPWLEEDYDKLCEMGFKVERYDIEGKSADEVRDKLKVVDIIFVSGGNVAYLLQAALESDFAYLVNEYVGKGKLYIGSSAGSIFVGPTIEPYVKNDLEDLSSDFHLTHFEGAGLIDFIIMPHYQKPSFRKLFDEYIIPTFGEKFAFRKLNDDEAFIVINGVVKLA